VVVTRNKGQVDIINNELSSKMYLYFIAMSLTTNDSNAILMRENHMFVCCPCSTHKLHNLGDYFECELIFSRFFQDRFFLDNPKSLKTVF